MPSFEDMFPSRFLKTSDLAGSEPIVTIQRIGFEDLDGEKKLVAYFVEPLIKPFILSAKINCNSIAQITGTKDYTKWPGARLCLFESTTEFKSELKPCIRIKPVPATAVAAAPARKATKGKRDADPTTESQVPF